MKTIKIVLIGFLMTSYNALSQNFDPSMNRNGVVDRSIGRTNAIEQQPSASDIEKKKMEQLDKIINMLKKELSLDELQAIAIRNEIEKNNRNVDIIRKKEISDDEKSKQIVSMMERTDKLVNSYLNKEQKEKYKILIENNKPKNKDKKKKTKDSSVQETKTEE